MDAPPFFEQLKENITEEEEGRKNKRKKQHYCTIVLLNMHNIPLVTSALHKKKSGSIACCWSLITIAKIGS